MRPGWDDYFFDMASVVAKRATCPRAAIGAVLVKNRRVIGSGYNGVPESAPHCPDTPEHHALDHCRAAIHAEYNALANALVPAFGATLYVVGPRRICPDCADRLSENGVTDIRWRPSALLSLDSLAREIRAWGASTFSTSNPSSTAEHLHREVDELIANPFNGEEQADVFHLLVQLARTTDVDLVAEVARKFAINRQRVWQAPDDSGVVEHVREAVS